MPSPPSNGNAGAREQAVAVAEHAALSDLGREREGNEDSFLERPPLFAVADGMGGANAGEVASGIVVETLASAEGAGELAPAIERANEQIHSKAKADKALEGMGTTA